MGNQKSAPTAVMGSICPGFGSRPNLQNAFAALVGRISFLTRTGAYCERRVRLIRDIGILATPSALDLAESSSGARGTGPNSL